MTSETRHTALSLIREYGYSCYADSVELAADETLLDRLIEIIKQGEPYSSTKE